MDPLRFQRIQQIFLEAVELPADEREQFAVRSCGGDTALLSEILAWLKADGRGGSLLDGGIADIAGRILEEPLRLSGVSRSFGPYRLIRVLGEGGMGVVYLAERQDLGSTVAIKFLRDAWLSPSRRERFQSEQQTLAQLTHPSIARLYDAGTLEDGTPWFVMEYVDGLPLTDYCRIHDLSMDQRLRLFRSVCAAVQYAHEHAIIHRDLKPSNILVNGEGEPRLLDFGIAKKIHAEAADLQRTRTELRLLTPLYAAPEQIRGEQVGVYTDVYALGIILFEVLTGRLPFDFSSAADAERTVLETAPEKLSTAANKVRAKALGSGRAVSADSWTDLDVLSATAMHKEVSRRYRSVEALIRDVDHYLQDEPLEARADTLRYRAGKYLARHRQSVSIALSILLIVVALITFYTARLANARNGALDAAARAQRVQRFMTSLFEGGESSGGQPPEAMKVMDLLDRGVREARLLDREPGAQSDLYETLGEIYREIGNLARADSLLRRALDLRTRLFGPAARSVSDLKVLLARLRIDEGKLDEAERLANEALQQANSIRPKDEAAIAGATMAVGKVFLARAAYAEAIVQFERAESIYASKEETTEERSENLTELANAHFYLGHYDASESLNRRSLEIDRRLVGDRNPAIGDGLANLGAILVQRGRLSEAERMDRQALDISQSWFGLDHPETAGMQYALGGVLQREHHDEEAKTLMEQALKTRTRVFGEGSVLVANVRNDLAKIDLERGNFDRAEAGFQKALSAYRTLYGDRHDRVGRALANLSSVYLAKHEYARAARNLEDAVRVYSGTLPPGHQSTGIAQIELANALILDKRYEEAEAPALAGYQTVAKQSQPPPRWLEAGRKNLVTIYEATHRPELARGYRAPLTKAAAK